MHITVTVRVLGVHHLRDGNARCAHGFGLFPFVHVGACLYLNTVILKRETIKIGLPVKDVQEAAYGYLLVG